MELSVSLGSTIPGNKFVGGVGHIEVLFLFTESLVWLVHLVLVDVAPWGFQQLRLQWLLLLRTVEVALGVLHIRLLDDDLVVLQWLLHRQLGSIVRSGPTVTLVFQQSIFDRG
jgi:hypothetical protein